MNFQPFRPQPLPQFRRCTKLANFPQMQQGNAVAAFCLVQIWRGHHNAEPVQRQMRQRVPEFAARHRVHARGWFVQQQNLRLGHQRTGERQFLLHATRKPPRQPVTEAVHVEHGQVASAALFDVARRHAAQIANVADVFRHRQVRVEAEGLGEIAGLHARFTGRLAKDLHLAGSRFHHAGQDLKCCRFTRAIRPDQAEDFPRLNVETDAAYRLRSASLHLPVMLRQGRYADGICADGSRADGRHWITISASAGMPGLAKPMPVFICSFTPTTCFTRSSLK